MKRLSIALAAIGLSAGAFAALPATTDPTLVAVPQLPGGFVIGGTALYLQPSDTNGDLDYASVNTSTGATVTPFFFHSSLKNIEPGYDWGWGLNVGYIFPNTGNDVNLSWFTFNNDDTASTFLGVDSAFGNILPIFFSNGTHNGLIPGLSTITSARSKVEYDLNQVDLTAGQFIDVGCRLILHPNVGLRWASLERKIHSFYIAPGSTFSISTSNTRDGSLETHEKSDFSGIGPLAGLDASYYIGMGFGAVAHVDSALLVGNIDVDSNAFETENTVITATQVFDNHTYNADDIQRVVPVVDMKLGLDYTYVFNNAANSDLTLEAGWQFSNYFNAVDRLHVVVADLPDLRGTIVNRTTSDFAIQGPYVSLVFHA